MPLREIVEEQSATEIIDENIRLFPRVEDVFSAIKWELARDPSLGVQVGSYDPPLFIKSSINYGRKDIPILVSLYQFDDNRVIIHSVRVRS